MDGLNERDTADRVVSKLGCLSAFACRDTSSLRTSNLVETASASNARVHPPSDAVLLIGCAGIANAGRPRPTADTALDLARANAASSSSSEMSADQPHAAATATSSGSCAATSMTIAGAYKRST